MLRAHALRACACGLQDNEKASRLEMELNQVDEKRAIVFVNTKAKCDFVSKHLENLGYRCTVLHGSKTQVSASWSCRRSASPCHHAHAYSAMHVRSWLIVHGHTAPSPPPGLLCGQADCCAPGNAGTAQLPGCHCSFQSQGRPEISC